MDFTPPAIEAFCRAHSLPESPALRAIREDTERTEPMSRMLTGPLEAALLKSLVRAARPRLVVEVGTFTGYSALAMAEELEGDARLVTCEIEERLAVKARAHLDRSPAGARVEIRLGPALDTLASLRAPVDLVFVDADKERYPDYYERAVDLLRPGGFLVVDNMLWSGEVLKDPPPDEETAAIVETARRAARDARVAAALLPVRDGVLVATKR